MAALPLLLSVLVTLAVACRGTAGSPGARLVTSAPGLSFDATTRTVRASGLDRRLLAALRGRLPDAPGLDRAFAVYLGDAAVPMLGDYRVEGDVLSFAPRLPLLPGHRYRAVLDPRQLAVAAGMFHGRPPEAAVPPPAGTPALSPAETPAGAPAWPQAGAPAWPPAGPPVRPPAEDHPLPPAATGPPAPPVRTLAFELPASAASIATAPPAERARVTVVYPSGDVVPANLLRIYVQFSRPMTRRGIARHVRLLDGAGNPVPRVFLEMPDGLWDPEGRRLTLFLDPGRIKRGVGAHEALGMPLQAGRRYRLVVAADAEDEDGMPLAGPFVKELRVAAADRVSPDVHRWRPDVPPPGSRQALVVTADKPLDQALFARVLRLLDAAGRPVPGEASVEAGETRWRFSPAEPWRQGDYVLHVGGDLEDLAGNRPTRLFDEPAALGGQRREARDVELRLRISPRARR